MKGDTDVGSILMADIGSVGTKVALFDVVDGRYRFVVGGRAVTAVHPSLADVGLGVWQAAEQIQMTVGRQLVDQGGVVTPELADGTGADLFGVTTSCRGALRVLAFGVVDESSLKSALSGVCDASIQIVASISLQSALGEGETYLGRILESLRRFQPEALLLLGGPGTDARATVAELGQVLVAVHTAIDGPRFPVVFSGDRASGEVLAHLFRGKYDLRCVDDIVEESGAEAKKALEQTLSGVWAESAANGIPGFSRVRSWMTMSPVYAPQALATVTRFLASYYGAEVWCADVGATTTCVFVAAPDAFLPIVREGLGVGMGAIGAIAAAESVERWLVGRMPWTAIRDALMNKRVRPWTLPAAADALVFEAALARETIRQVLGNDVPEVGEVRPLLRGGLVVGCGAVLAQAPTDGLSALNLLDSLQPAGIGSLAIDRLSILPQLGALGISYPVPATQALLADGLHWLGTYVAPEGTMGDSATALTLTLERSGGGRVDLEVPFGSLRVIPLGYGDQAELKVRPHKKLDVGAGKGQPASLKARGGSLGVIVDARGRPINVPSAPEERWAKLRGWRRVLEGDICR